MNSKTKQIVFGALAVIGLVATWYYNIQFMQQYGGFTLGQFLDDLHSTHAGRSIANDLTVVVATFLFWSFFEARRLKMFGWWLYFIFTFLIAAAVTIPLFFMMRERALCNKISE